MVAEWTTGGAILSKKQNETPNLVPFKRNSVSASRTNQQSNIYLVALRDLQRKRAEIDMAIEAILKTQPDLRRSTDSDS